LAIFGVRVDARDVEVARQTRASSCAQRGQCDADNAAAERTDAQETQVDTQNVPPTPTRRNPTDAVTDDVFPLARMSPIPVAARHAPPMIDAVEMVASV
jgi:hypothetical protein